jgi:chloramphenicol 3-O-phosphotransferase
MQTASPIFWITGVPGAGKSSVATALMQRFPYGLHLPIDNLRARVVSGMANPILEWTDETSRQFQLARQSAAQMARTYADAGFAVAIDDIIFPHEVQALCDAWLPGYPIGKVFLQPEVDVALARNATRTNKPFDTSILVDTIIRLHQALAAQNFAASGWLIIDTSEMDVEETVDEILKRSTTLAEER